MLRSRSKRAWRRRMFTPRSSRRARPRKSTSRHPLGRSLRLDAPPADAPERADQEELPRKGAWPAKVVIVEYSDFECPFCSRGAKTVEDILKNHGKDVYFIYKHNPLGFHPNAEPAAACGGSGWDAG